MNNRRSKSGKKHDRKYLLWRVKNLYLHDVIHVEEYLIPGKLSFIGYTARVIDIQAFASEWRVVLRNDTQVHSFIIPDIDDLEVPCLIRRIDLVKENCNGDVVESKFES